MRGSGLDWSMVRPPAVYGPGDRETLELFKMAKLGVTLMPPAGRVSLIHAADLARLLVALTGPEAAAQIVIEPDDGQPNGWNHRQFLRAVGEAVGKKPLIVAVPALVLRAAARLDLLVRRHRARLTPDRVAYFLHRDWVVSPKLGAPPTLWTPQVDTHAGLAETARWYATEGWL